MTAPDFLAPAYAHAGSLVSIADSLADYHDDTAVRCRVRVWSDQLPDGEMALLKPHLTHGNIRPVFDHLKRDGINLPYSATSWERHWTGRCTCTHPEPAP